MVSGVGLRRKFVRRGGSTSLMVLFVADDGDNAVPPAGGGRAVMTGFGVDATAGANK